MGFRFYKRINILPGISMNLSKSGPSFSFGPKGMKMTLGGKGVRSSFSIPGTGVYYTTYKGYKKSSKGGNSRNIQGDGNQTGNSGTSAVAPNLGFFQGLFMSPQEKSFLTGIKAFAQGKNDEALRVFSINHENADSLFMAGYIALGNEEYFVAEDYLTRCKQRLNELGTTISKFNSDFELTLAITDYIEIPINLDFKGLTLAIVEAYQNQEKYNEAINSLEELWNQNPSDKVICLSMIDLIAHHEPAVKQHLTDIIEATKDIDNDEPIDTNIIYLRGFALYSLGLVDAGTKQLTDVLRRKKDRPADLLLQIRYIRGRIYEEAGQGSKAKSDYEKVYLEEPNFEDVKERLGL
ncbi:DUF4236 domain-containing protein [Clostridium estertheticum]|uniref:DUF4236 domain-containing protein n=1 Tax=Clostridium estertheticum TaxID=238834 RepID=UPI0013E95713|nr:DUF4236 domain-containing protein [Clostridium estertheticum]MBZ9688614.1 DUF4236 domain-containing protein [Clostridium estertheticum]